MQRIHLTFDKN